jgi:signal transduction histidine kinase
LHIRRLPGEVAIGLAHSINNILTAISVSAELLQMDPATLGPQAAHDILAAVDRGTQLVHRLYALSAGGDPPKSEPVALADLCHGVLQLLEPQLSRQSIAVESRVPPEARVMGDSSMLQQVVMNLTINSIHAMPDGGTLTLSVRTGGGKVALCVGDTGCGIPPEHIDRIFLPFFTTRSGSTGTGLGLSSSLTMVRAMGGDIAVESQVGKGSVFVVRLPEV